jgi:hypothetical protein
MVKLWVGRGEIEILWDGIIELTNFHVLPTEATDLYPFVTESIRT